MAWWGLIGGLVAGGLGWGWSGAIVLGFVGWLAGIIIGSKKSAAPVAAAKPPVTESTADRIERLERTILSLQMRVEKLEGGDVVTTQLVAAAEEAAREAIEVSVAPERAAVEAVEAAHATPPVAPEPPPVPPPPPPKPNPIVAWFLGGNAIVRIGALILFVGLIFLLNYAREHQMIAPEFRVAGVALVGIALLIVGWRLRNRVTGYAVSLQGAGIAVLYLTIFSAMRLYHLIPPSAAFFLLAAMAAFSAMIAVGQNSLALAVIGAGGGFLAPILASTGSGNHVALFGYYLILTLGLVAIAWFKAWRILNVVGFAFTFLIALVWGERAYRPELFGTTEPFLVVFFLLYVAIAILFARSSVNVIPEAKGTVIPDARNAGNDPGSIRTNLIDTTITFGNPIAAFGLQAGIVRHIEFGLAYSSLIAAAIYLVLATLLHRLHSERWRLLAESFLALGVVFATLAIPLALDARWTSAAWALEGAAIVWIGIRQRRTLGRAFGLLLQFLAGGAYLYAYSRMPMGFPFFDAPFIGALLIALAGIWTQRLLATNAERVTPTEVGLAPAMFLWGIVWLLFAGSHEIETFLPRDVRMSAYVAVAASVALVFLLLSRWRDGPEARWPAIGLMPALAVLAVVQSVSQSHPFEAYGWLAWPFAFAVLVFALRDFGSLLHTGTFLLACALGAWEMDWAAAQVTAHGTAWSVTSVLLVPAMLVLFIVARELDDRWPVRDHLRAYRINAVLTVLVAMGVWILYANATHDGTSTPLPYMPLLNAIDLGHGLIAVCVAGSLLAWRRSQLELPALFRGRTAWALIGVLSFIWLNGILLRSIHHWADVPYTFTAMMRSVIAQASLSIFWSVIALTLMVFATRRGLRTLWMVGGALMAVVVVKLILVDLGHLSGIERIVSFIAVGVLMLVIGYFSPVPPRKAEAVSAEVPA
jgi:uncharacterized membrane protein